MSSYTTLGEVHGSMGKAVAWVDRALHGVARDQIVSISHSAVAAGTNFGITTLVVLSDAEDSSAGKSAQATAASGRPAEAEQICDIVITALHGGNAEPVRLMQRWTGAGVDALVTALQQLPYRLALGAERHIAETRAAELTAVGVVAEVSPR